MTRSVVLFLLVALVALSFAPKVAAFGAGNIPSYSHLEDRAFRHGDIEDIIEKLFKAAGGGFLSRGSKFSSLDVKRVYFGNWLRDYSQAVDTAGLSKTNLQTIINVVMVLGFLAHGYATAEFEVTPERLGCYLPTEHIDNPKGYAEGQDARRLDSRLRGPVNPEELQIDPRTGMKNYIANEQGNWDTSKGLVRRRLQECIDYGRRYKSSGNDADQYEAFRLLGSSLHTLEDFTAHSNFCELALVSMGHHNVFTHVGRNVRVRAPNGRDVCPLITGTFGGADFVHSLMGEATDHLSAASVSDLTQKVNSARSVGEGQNASSQILRTLFTNIPGGDGEQLTREMDGVSNMRAGQPGGLDPYNMSPQQMHDTLWTILSFRDSVMKKIEMTIDKIPGLSGLVEKISNNVSVFIITTLEPFVKPLISTAVGALGQTSQAVIDNHDQEEVWNDGNASDPTHSFLSKDHFALILNQPAGEIARTIVEFAVNLVVKAWDDNSMSPQSVTEPILECLFHPDFINPNSQIQRMMMDKLHAWFEGCGRDRNEILNRLTSDAVRGHRNKRLGDNTDAGGGAHDHGSLGGGLQGVLASHNASMPGANILNSAQDLMGGKMPWQPGFGSGGPNAWREMDSNGQYQGQDQGQGQQHNAPQYNAPAPHYQPPPQEYNSYQAPPQQSYNSYQGPPPQQYNQGGYDQNQNQGYGHQQQNFGGGGGYGGPPQFDNGSQGYQQGPPQGQWGNQNQGGYQHQQHHQPPPDNGGGGWGPPGGYRG